MTDSKNKMVTLGLPMTCDVYTAAYSRFIERCKCSDILPEAIPSNRRKIVIFLVTDQFSQSIKHIKTMHSYSHRFSILSKNKFVDEIIPLDLVTGKREIFESSPRFILHGDDWNSPDAIAMKEFVRSCVPSTTSFCDVPYDLSELDILRQTIAKCEGLASTPLMLHHLTYSMAETLSISDTPAETWNELLTARGQNSTGRKLVDLYEFSGDLHTADFRLSESSNDNFIVGIVPMSADIFHFGHHRLIKYAHDYLVEYLYSKPFSATDKIRLIVLLHSDESIKSYKRTPIFDLKRRSEVVDSLTTVSFVDVNDCMSADDYSKFVLRLKPSFVIHGNDWIGSPFRNNLIECMDMEKCKLIEPDYTAGISTTVLINKLAA